MTDPKSSTPRLDFEDGRLVKVNGMRPEHMGGHALIAAVRLLGAEIYAQIEKKGSGDARCKVPEGQTPLDDNLHHRLLDVFQEGCKARDTGANSPYHGQSLEHCLHAAGWVQRDLRLALDDALGDTHPPAEARDAPDPGPGPSAFEQAQIANMEAQTDLVRAQAQRDRAHAGLLNAQAYHLRRETGD